MADVAPKYPPASDVIPAPEGVPRGLQRIKFALEEITEAELAGLTDVFDEVPPTAPGLLIWLKRARAWELDRRAGIVYELHPPSAAISPEEGPASIDAACSLRKAFIKKPSAAFEFFDAVVQTLTGSHH